MQRFSSLFRDYARLLDITRAEQRAAIAQYTDLGNWLVDHVPGSSDVNVYPQGSFRLGTVVRPSDEGADFDLDLVLWRDLSKASITQAELKAHAGDLVTQYCDERGFREPIELGRCWRLEFFDDGFHMDVLPVIPEVETETGVLLTDRDLRYWLYSNPIGYADWFKERTNRNLFLERRIALAERLGRNVEDVPEHWVRTPLQRVVQLLKRSRDEFFSNSYQDGPPSILITTLAARAYQSQRDLEAALLETVEQMPSFIERRGEEWWVPNPAHENENFADKWNSDESRREAFFSWITALRTSLEDATSAASFTEAATILEPLLGPVSQEAARTATGLQLSETFKAARGESRAPREHMIDERCPVNIQHSASIICEVGDPVYANRYHRRRAERKRRLAKNRSLRFRVQTSVPPPYQVYWKVRNFGREAARAQGGLRGQIIEGDIVENSSQEAVHTESTLYRGAHYIDCYVIKDGVCVAEDREWVPIA